MWTVNMERAIASCRIDNDWMVQIEDIAEKTGQTPSDVFRAALAEYLKRDRSMTIQSQVADLIIRMDALEDRHRALATLVATGR